MPFDVLLLPGDGIGGEVMGQAEAVIAFLNRTGLTDIRTEADLAGGTAYDRHGHPLGDATLARAQACGTVLFGAVGGEQWDHVPYHLRPEIGFMRLRKEMDLFANLRPAVCPPALAGASSLKPELVDGLDLMIVRELTGGVYFGEPKEIVTQENGRRRAVDTQVYDEDEIERIAYVAFRLAGERQGRLASVEKSNVMKSGLLWRQVVSRMQHDLYPQVELVHLLADNCAMQLVRRPKQFDVILADNLFGDMLSDVAAMAAGSLGMLPSASLGAPDAQGRLAALYEPVHGSAPDIAGKGIANPIAMIASLGMLLRHSMARHDLADALDRAIAAALATGTRTADVAGAGTPVGTTAMGAAIIAALAEELEAA
ncbi:3-isopropylmalate dehydrogenase [Novosphingobium colocasiae]|uniref:3-isopropylmalate dehydrogenase n=1 Tax=Novosphingobium colocasiae TaxID=1256513 RepID=A0A918UGG1_9SPHN|nr:3-isopropylmalate dehydrogenase [Novosphingobium colocasiae]GGZ05507.1 3-isopropylmalate dehydrogenase [Novosphingobium colocasiae]